MNQTYMKEEKVFPLIVKMSLPMVVSMLVNSMYNIVDSFFVAKISENAMTALSLVFPVQNLINAVMIGFGIGVNAAIAYFLGARDTGQPGNRPVRECFILLFMELYLLFYASWVCRFSCGFFLPMRKSCN